jgi:hypothetical protein
VTAGDPTAAFDGCARPRRPGPDVLGWAGGVVATALAFVTAVWEAFLTPLALHWHSGGHAHSVRLPVALVCAVAGNAALTWFVHSVTGKVLAVLVPFAAWTVPMMIATRRTYEGDLVITSNWVGLSTIFVGALTFALVAYRLTIRSLALPK